MNLTLPQKNMYETEQFFEGTSICNIGGLVIFKDHNINITTLEKAINKVIEKSDALRIRLNSKGKDVFQDFYDYKYENIESVNLTSKEYKFVMETWTAIPFDLSKKLYDFKIVKIDDKIAVYTKLHHIVSDAWSTLMVVSKVVEYYYKTAYMINIPEDDIPSYKKFVEKENDYLSSKRFKSDEEFWQKKYIEKPAFVTMSPDKKSDLDVKARRSSFVVPIKETELIRKYCNDNNISPAVLLEAITALYASRINGADDITLCSLVVNRSGIEEKNTVGMFNNILPLTIKINYDDTFVSLCQNVSNEHYEVFRHQRYPLSNIMSYVREKHGKDTALYDIMVSYQNAKLSEEIGSKASAYWIFNQTSDLGFMLNISDRNNDERLNFDFDYRINCFTDDEIEKIYYRFINMVNQVVIEPLVKCKDIEIVTLQEREQILVDFNNTMKLYPAEKSIFSFLEENAKKNPNKIALMFENQTMTYGEFNKKVNSLANYLINVEKRRNAIIGIMTSRSFEMLIGVYAILKSGNAYMPMDVNFPDDRIDFMLEDSQSKIVLTQNDLTKRFENKNLEVINLNRFEYEKYDEKNLKQDIQPYDVAYVIYTSGSTGKPKGAMVYHHSVINRIKWMHDKYPLKEDDVILQKTPYTFDVSVWELFWWSMYNGSLKILIPDGHKDPKEIIEGIYEGKVTHMHFVPSMLNAFLEYLEANKNEIVKLKSLRYVFASGEALQVMHVKKFYELLEANKTTLHNLYGPTECTVDVSYYDCDKDSIPSSIPIGKPIDNTQLIILDKHKKLVPIGITGELYISGVLVGKGYLNRPELTDEKFVPNLYYNFPKMYKTGDLAMWREDGNIEYLGRTDFQVKIHGLRIELGDIENSILKFKGIKQCIVNSFENNGEKSLCAYYTSDNEIDISELKGFMSKELPNYMIPSAFMRMDKIPVNANGKADRKALPIPTIEKEIVDYVEPKNNVERDVQSCIEDILNIQKISTNQDLFDIGLSSIGVISFITKLSTLGYELKVKDFYDCHTIAEIADFLQMSSFASDDYEEDKKYYSNISDISNHLIPSKSKSGVLITGATSFLGIHIIDELIKNSDRIIYCLIRSQEKFERFIKEYTSFKADNPRIKVVFGDITKHNMGFDEQTADDIKKNISDIIHCAANVSFFCPWESSRAVNYIGTCNVIDFAKESNSKLHHISTMSVSGDILTKQTKEAPEFTESDLYIGQLYKENVYVYSKYLAEKEVIKAIRENRINASIYRIANLTWRTNDYKFQENFKDNDLFITTKVILHYNKVPLELINEDLSMAPVDEVAKSIVNLLDINENKVYNLYSNHGLNMINYIRALTTPEIVPIKEFASLLNLDSKNYDESNFLLMYISSIVNNPSKMIVSFRNNDTSRFLDSIGFKWTELGDKYASGIKKLLDK